MILPENNFLVSSVNCQGLRDRKKRLDVINYLKETESLIICLQDTHLNEADTKDLKIFMVVLSTFMGAPLTLEELPFYLEITLSLKSIQFIRTKMEII